MPWSQAGATPGSILRAELEGNSTFVLDVRDEHGQELPLYAVDVTLRRLDSGPVTFWPNRMRMHAGEIALSGGRLSGMIAGDYSIAVSVESLGTRALEVDGLLPDETRALSFVFGPPLALSGRVLRPDGRPVAGCPVVLLKPAAEDDSPASPILLRDFFYHGEFDPEMAEYRREEAKTTSDAEGRFRFEIEAGNSYALCAFLPQNRMLATATASLSVDAEEPADDLELVLPATGRLRGRIRTPVEGIVPGLRVWAVQDDAVSLFSPVKTAAFELAADGSYELGALACGRRTSISCYREGPSSSGPPTVTRTERCPSARSKSWQARRFRPTSTPRRAIPERSRSRCS